MTTKWQKDYRAKLCDAAEAVKVIRSGDNVQLHPGCAEPLTLVNAMTARAPELADVKVWHMLTFGPAPYMAPEMAGHFRHMAYFCGGNSRAAVNEGRAEYIPIYLYQIGLRILDGSIPSDVVLCNLSPPDEHGWCSFGAGIDYTHPACVRARDVVAQINPRVPRTLGDSFIHVSRLSRAVEVDEPLKELPAAGAISEVARKIGRNVAALIEDGATMQTGIGAIPDAVLAELGDRKDLGIHSEMFSDGVIDLVEKGVITGARKTFHAGKMVAGFVLGTGRLTRFIHDNPACEFHPQWYVNDPFNVARNAKMVAINSALEVDLTGQVCADSIGTQIYSGFGGQVDFIRGAAHSPGGKPIIALCAATKEDTISRIVPTLKLGAGVVTNRADVHYVVTEYGVAYLHGKSLQERARALVAVAHPNFREGLEKAARERKLL